MIRTIKYQLYLLQLENYDLRRYWRLVPQTIFSRAKMRQKIVWTPKLVVVFALALFVQFAVSYVIPTRLRTDEIYLGLFPVAFLFLFLLLSFFHFVFLSAAVLLLKPVDYSIKNYLTGQAKIKMRQLYVDRHIVVIGITGSYGKTTMKEILATILGEKFNILKTPESVNTPVGISRIINKELKPSTEIFIVEMGAYHLGDIRKLCEIAKPDMAVITGINEAHLERFGSIENTMRAKFEIVENAAFNALVVMNGDDELVRENYKRFVRGRRVVLYSSTPHPAGVSAHPLLGEYIWGVLNACGIIAKELGMTDKEIGSGILKLKPIPHRLQKIENPNGITVIDDSYNGNPDGVREAIKALAGFSGRRRIYITPGLVEMGEQSRQIHKDMGRQLVGVADVVILIRNSATPYIEEGMTNLTPALSSRGEGGKPKIVHFDSAAEAHNFLPKILKPGDVVMFQNDWPDNYK